MLFAFLNELYGKLLPISVLLLSPYLAYVLFSMFLIGSIRLFFLPWRLGLLLHIFYLLFFLISTLLFIFLCPVLGVSLLLPVSIILLSVIITRLLLLPLNLLHLLPLSIVFDKSSFLRLFRLSFLNLLWLFLGLIIARLFSFVLDRLRWLNNDDLFLWFGVFFDECFSLFLVDDFSASCRLQIQYFFLFGAINNLNVLFSWLVVWIIVVYFRLIDLTQLILKLYKLIKD